MEKISSRKSVEIFGLWRKSFSTKFFPWWGILPGEFIKLDVTCQIYWFNNGKNGIHAHLTGFYFLKLPKNLQKYKNLQIMIKITFAREKWRNTSKWRKFSLAKVFTTKFCTIKNGNKIKYLNENGIKVQDEIINLYF